MAEFRCDNDDDGQYATATFKVLFAYSGWSGVTYRPTVTMSAHSVSPADPKLAPVPRPTPSAVPPPSSPQTSSPPPPLPLMSSSSTPSLARSSVRCPSPHTSPISPSPTQPCSVRPPMATCVRTTPAPLYAERTATPPSSCMPAAYRISKHPATFSSQSNQVQGPFPPCPLPFLLTVLRRGHDIPDPLVI